MVFVQNGLKLAADAVLRVIRFTFLDHRSKKAICIASQGRVVILRINLSLGHSCQQKLNRNGRYFHFIAL